MTKKKSAESSEKSKRAKKPVVLVQDALGRLYAIPADLAKDYSLTDKQAAKLVKAARSENSSLEKAMADGGFVRQLDKEELPNFRLLMQTEYKQSPER
jgi:hypothetical protein